MTTNMVPKHSDGRWTNTFRPFSGPNHLSFESIPGELGGFCWKDFKTARWGAWMPIHDFGASGCLKLSCDRGSGKGTMAYHQPQQIAQVITGTISSNTFMNQPGNFMILHGSNVWRYRGMEMFPVEDETSRFNGFRNNHDVVELDLDCDRHVLTQWKHWSIQ